jgi:hypothetical protein
MLVDPLSGRFTFHVFGHKNQVVVFSTGVENSGDIIVIEFPRRLCAFFESDPLAFAQTGQRNELHRNRSPSVVADCFVSNDGAVAPDLARQSIVV